MVLYSIIILLYIRGYKTINKVYIFVNFKYNAFKNLEKLIRAKYGL